MLGPLVKEKQTRINLMTTQKRGRVLDPPSFFADTVSRLLQVRITDVVTPSRQFFVPPLCGGVIELAVIRAGA